MPIKCVKIPQSPNWYLRGVDETTKIKVYESTGLAVGTATLRARKAAIKAKVQWCRGEHQRLKAAIAQQSKAECFTFGFAYWLYVEDDCDIRFAEKIDAIWADKPVSEITSKAVKVLAKEMYPDAVAATLNRQVVAMVQAVLNNAGSEDNRPIVMKAFGVEPRKDILFKKFPTTTEDRRRVRQKRKAVNYDWLILFIKHAKNPRIAAMEAVMYTCGARIGEVCNFMVEDFLPDTQTIWAYDTKNGKDHAYTIPLWVCNMVKAVAPAEGKLFGYKNKGSIYTPWTQTCAAANIERITPHSAGRRSMVTEVVDRQGRDIKAAQEIGNWRNERVLREHYVLFENKRKQSQELFPEPDWTQFDSDVVVQLRRTGES